MESTIHAFGDSFVAADLDERHDDIEYRHYLKYNVSYASQIAKHFNMSFKNYAEYGSGNWPQCDHLTVNLKNGNIKSSDVVLFGFSASGRGRAGASGIIPKHIFKAAVAAEELYNNTELLCQIDYYYQHAILDVLSHQYNIKIIKYNIFDNWSSDLIQNNNFISHTLIDILNDTVNSNERNVEHWLINVPPGYEHLYSPRKHPSIEGHKKIANWFIKNVDFTSNTQVQIQ